LWSLSKKIKRLLNGPDGQAGDGRNAPLQSASAESGCLADRVLCSFGTTKLLMMMSVKKTLVNLPEGRVARLGEFLTMGNSLLWTVFSLIKK
jgi:hypothetical protein